MHNTPEALHYFNESLAIYRVNYGSEHEKIKRLEAQLAKSSKNRNTRITHLKANNKTLNIPASGSRSHIVQQTSSSMPKSSLELIEVRHTVSNVHRTNYLPQIHCKFLPIVTISYY
jgi:hypothetical protein